MGPRNVDGLICQSEMPTSVDNVDWYLHPTQQTTDDSDRIGRNSNTGTDSRGWRRNRATDVISASETDPLVRLTRDDKC